MNFATPLIVDTYQTEYEVKMCNYAKGIYNDLHKIGGGMRSAC